MRCTGTVPPVPNGHSRGETRSPAGSRGSAARGIPSTFRLSSASRSLAGEPTGNMRTSRATLPGILRTQGSRSGNRTTGCESRHPRRPAKRSRLPTGSCNTRGLHQALQAPAPPVSSQPPCLHQRPSTHLLTSHSSATGGSQGGCTAPPSCRPQRLGVLLFDEALDELILGLVGGQDDVGWRLDIADALLEASSTENLAAAEAALKRIRAFKPAEAETAV